MKLLLVLIKQTLWLIRPAEPVMVLNKLYDLSNANEIICLSRMLNRSDSTYHISLNFFVIADMLVFTLSYVELKSYLNVQFLQRTLK